MIADIRGAGLMIGMEFAQAQSSRRGKKIIPATEKAKAFVAEALRGGVVLLPCGPSQNVISITPPFVISEKEIAFCITLFDKILSKLI